MPAGWLGFPAPTTLPFYSSFNTAAQGGNETFANDKGVLVTRPITGMGISTQTLYLWIGLGLATAIGLGVILFTGSVMVAIMAMLAICYAMYDQQILPGAIFFLIVVMGIGILYISRQN
jgi:hypothetical protein